VIRQYARQQHSFDIQNSHVLCKNQYFSPAMHSSPIMCNCTAAMTGKPTFRDQLKLPRIHMHPPKHCFFSALSFGKRVVRSAVERVAQVYHQAWESEGTGLASALMRSDTS